MKARFMSDVHNEFGVLRIPALPDDAKTVLVLAGDVNVWTKKATLAAFIEEVKNRFLCVIYIPGNHEYYGGGNLSLVDNKYREAFAPYPEIRFVNRETVVIDNVAFICATLWTSFNKGDWAVMHAAQTQMNDYRQIRWGAQYRKLTPAVIAALHIDHLAFITSEIHKAKAAGQKVVVVSHHAPSWLSIATKYRERYDPLNWSYASELETLILDTAPELWVHGHTHTSFDYTIGTTRVLCNPRGYAGHELNADFDPLLTVEL